MIIFPLLTLLIGVSFAADPLGCPSDWYFDGKLKKCYKVITQNGGFTFDQGNDKCKSLGGQLASIHSADENELVSTLSNQAKAIGGSQTLIGAQRTGPKATNWKWSDGTKWDYTNWSPSNPDNHLNGQACVQLMSTIWGPGPPDYYRPQKWDDLECKSLYQNAVCKKAATNVRPPVQPCPSADWTHSPTLKACYKAVNQTGVINYEQGDKMCKDLGAQLASVHSAEEDALISKISNQGRPTSGAQTLIGGQRTGPNPKDWKWSDGTKWDYDNWLVGIGPDRADQGCIQVLSTEYGPNPPGWFQYLRWDDVQCTAFQVAVCKKPIV